MADKSQAALPRAIQITFTEPQIKTLFALASLGFATMVQDAEAATTMMESIDANCTEAMVGDALKHTMGVLDQAFGVVDTGPKLVILGDD